MSTRRSEAFECHQKLLRGLPALPGRPVAAMPVVRDPGQARAANHRNVTWVWLFRSERRDPGISGPTCRLHPRSPRLAEPRGSSGRGSMEHCRGSGHGNAPSTWFGPRRRGPGAAAAGPGAGTGAPGSPPSRPPSARAAPMSHGCGSSGGRGRATGLTAHRTRLPPAAGTSPGVPAAPAPHAPRRPECPATSM